MSINDTDLIEVIRAGVSYKATGAQLADQLYTPVEPLLGPAAAFPQFSVGGNPNQLYQSLSLDKVSDRFIYAWRQENNDIMYVCSIGVNDAGVLSAGTVYQASAAVGGRSLMVYDEAKQKTVLVWWADGIGEVVRARTLTGNASNGNLSLGPEISLSTMGNTQNGTMAVNYDKNTGKHFASWGTDNQPEHMYGRVFTVNSNGTISLGTQKVVQAEGLEGQEYYPYGVAAHDSANKLICFYGQNDRNPQYVYSRVITISGTDFNIGGQATHFRIGNPGFGSVNPDGGPYPTRSYVFCSANNLTYQSNYKITDVGGGHPGLEHSYMKPYSCSGNTVTLQPETILSTTESCTNIQFAYDEKSGYIVVFRERKLSNKTFNDIKVERYRPNASGTLSLVDSFPLGEAAGSASSYCPMGKTLNLQPNSKGWLIFTYQNENISTAAIRARGFRVGDAQE